MFLFFKVYSQWIMMLVSEESIYKHGSWNSTFLVPSASLWSPIRYLRSFYLWFLILHECMNSCTRPHQPHTHLIFISNKKRFTIQKANGKSLSCWSTFHCARVHYESTSPLIINRVYVSNLSCLPHLSHWQFAYEMIDHPYIESW